MNQKLKKILNVVLTIAVFTLLLCGCKNGNTSATDNNSGKNENNKEEYVARIKAYKEYYEGIESDYYSVEGMILVHEDGMPYMLLCCEVEQDVSNYKIQLIDFKDGNAELCGEKDFYYDGLYFVLTVAKLDNRCIIEVMGDNAVRTQYWEFVEDNLLAQKLSEEEVAKLNEITARNHVYNVAEKPFEYLYTYDDQKVFIYDKESDVDTVNKIALEKIYDYMQLSDEQKEYLVIPPRTIIKNEELTTYFVNIYSVEIWHPFYMKGVTLKQYLNELIKEPIYCIEDISAKEYGFCHGRGATAEEVANRKEIEIEKIMQKMPQYNPYDTDKRLLMEYHDAIEILLQDYAELLPYEETDLATIVGTYEIKQVLEQFEAGYEFGGRKPLQYDFVFTSDEFKGATWKDITFNGSHEYPVLTLTKNGNTLSYSGFDGYVEFRENTELKSAIEEYAWIAGNLNRYAIVCSEVVSDYDYAFVYIDEDDIPEMIASFYDYTYGHFANWIYSYKDGDVIYSPFNPADMSFGGYIPKQNNIAILEEDYFYEDDGTSYRDGKYTQYSILDNEFKYVKDIDLTEEYESVSFDEDMMSALGKIYSLRNE